MKFIDTHAHLYLSQFDSDIDMCIERAQQSGVSKVILPNIDVDSLESMIALHEHNPAMFYPLLGLHPTHVDNSFEEKLEKLFEMFDKHSFAGIGEIGIDLYWDKTYFIQQQEAFRRQIMFALGKDLPLVIHARDSLDEIFEILNEINSSHFKGVFHAFSGNTKQAQKVVDMGFLLGIGGVLTFKNSHLPEVVSNIDLNHIVLETDSPYLAPVPHRGKRNESSYIPLIANKIAEIKERSLEEVAEKTTYNAVKIFNI